LLEGQRLDTSELPYEFDTFHLGLVAKGPGAEEAIREIARPLDRRLLLVPRGEETVWAWLGGRRTLDLEDLKRTLSEGLPTEVSLAIGEPGEGLGGWRFTHRQAKAALPVALHGSEPCVRYVDVALLAAVARDELLATTLRQIYLEPLERDGGEVLCRTLRAYLAAERNASSAASALGVRRHTVTSRLRTIEQRLGCSLTTHATEIDTALRLQALTQAGRPSARSSTTLAGR
jgi:sugar diacid utilization regulator